MKAFYEIDSKTFTYRSEVEFFLSKMTFLNAYFFHRSVTQLCTFKEFKDSDEAY